MAPGSEGHWVNAKRKNFKLNALEGAEVLRHFPISTCGAAGGPREAVSFHERRGRQQHRHSRRHWRLRRPAVERQEH